jgi:hypothetical protein
MWLYLVYCCIREPIISRASKLKVQANPVGAIDCIDLAGTCNLWLSTINYPEIRVSRAGRFGSSASLAVAQMPTVRTRSVNAGGFTPNGACGTQFFCDPQQRSVVVVGTRRAANSENTIVSSLEHRLCRDGKMSSLAFISRYRRLPLASRAVQKREYAAVILPDRQITLVRAGLSAPRCQAPRSKIFCFTEYSEYHILVLSRPTTRGVSRSSLNAGRDAVDAESTPDEGA